MRKTWITFFATPSYYEPAVGPTDYRKVTGFALEFHLYRRHAGKAYHMASGTWSIPTADWKTALAFKRVVRRATRAKGAVLPDLNRAYRAFAG